MSTMTRRASAAWHVSVRTLLIACLVAMAMAGAVAIPLAISSDDESLPNTPATLRGSPPADPGTRYDGGPEEGSRGLVKPLPQQSHELSHPGARP
jgi:hypothetical protein